MIQENKQLLLKDLCARLLYGVICNTPKGDGYLCSINQTVFGTEYGFNVNPLKRDYFCFGDSETDEQVIKPYLRPMSSMTEEEKDELYTAMDWYGEIDESGNVYTKGQEKVYRETFYEYTDWLISHHFDFRGLIPMGLALEAPDNMYKTE